MPEDLFDRSRFDSFFVDFLEFIEVLLQFEKAVPVGSPSGRELIPVLYEKNYLGTAVRNFDVIKISPNSSILPKYFCLDTPQNKVLSLNQ